MPATRHIEKHFRAGKHVRNVVIGMADGLTVPFALAAGLSGAVGSTRIIVTAGLAEIAAGAIAMGFGGYLAARGDAEHYAAERRREEQEICEKPEIETKEIADIFTSYGLKQDEVGPLVRSLRARPKAWVDFMMRFELGLEEPISRDALVGAATIGGSYVVGGLIPLLPYMLAGDASNALSFSTGVTLAALALFGYVKGKLIGTVHPLRSALQTMGIGATAAWVAFLIARWVS